MVHIMRILLAEDELSLSKALIKIFELNNFSADAVYNGEDAISYIETGNYDILVLDIMMPKLDGIEVLRRIRAKGIETPVIVLTAKADIDDKVLGLDSGANDYLTKPFETKELLARIRALTRSKGSQDSTLKFGNIKLNRATFELSSDSNCCKLANKEFQMMEMLISNPKQLISVERFMEKIWGYDTDAEINVVWVYISYLRKKLKSLDANIKITASRNAGYALEETDD